MSYTPKTLSEGTHTVTNAATTTLATVPALTRWIINSFKFTMEQSAGSGSPTYTVNAGALELFKIYDSGGHGLSIPSSALATGRGFLDLIQSVNTAAPSSIMSHEPLILEAGKTITVTCDTGGGNTFAGTYNISGVEADA